MKKLQLNPEALEVQSFETSSGASAAGTVRGNGDSGCVATYDPCTCVPIDTCSCVPDTGTKPAPEPVPWPGGTGCVATYDPCTCVPIETCSCAPDDTHPAAGWR
jgi:hypothetical protein